MEHLEQFHILLARAAKLLHRVDGIDWKTRIAADAASDVPASSAPKRDVTKVVEEQDDDDDSSDDDMLLMMGGYSDSEDDEMPGVGGFEDEEEEEQDDIVVEGEDDEEEEEALLKRAASVHAALLLSVSSPAGGGKELVQKTVEAILSNDSKEDLASALSFAISSGSIDKRPTKVGPERWRRMCLTNSLLAVQFLLHLLHSSDNEVSALDDWNVAILPLLLGKPDLASSGINEESLFLSNDALREALLGLTSFSSTKGDDTQEGCTTTVRLCLEALHHAASSKGATLRQKKVGVVCQVLVCLHDNVARMASAAASLESAKDAMHAAVLAILRGICYEIVDEEGLAQPPLLSLESLRPVTGMLLPKLYPDVKGRGSGGCHTADGRAMELWRTILLLLASHSDSTREVAGSKMRCCKNWYVA